MMDLKTRLRTNHFLNKKGQITIMSVKLLLFGKYTTTNFSLKENSHSGYLSGKWNDLERFINKI